MPELVEAACYGVAALMVAWVGLDFWLNRPRKSLAEEIDEELDIWDEGT